MAAAEEKSFTMAGKDSTTIMAAAAEEEEKCVTMTGKDSTTAMAAAAEEEEEESVTKVFSMFHLDDDGLIILEDGKRMPSEFYANESITKDIERLESENQQLEDMLRSLQTTIAKVSEELEVKWEKRMEAIARQRENPEVIKIRAAIAEQIQQMEVICNRNLLNSAMEDAEKVTKGIEEAKEMVEKLAKAFNELESHREALLPNKTKWADIKEHFYNLEKSLQEKINEVEEKQRIFEEKQSEADKLVAEREAAVAAKELASLDLLQLMKDVAVSAISEAHENCNTPTPVLLDVKGSKDNKKDANNKKLGALRVITKYSEEYRLQEKYPIESLKKQIAQLEKARYNKKRLGQAAKTQAKKPRANGGYAPRKPAAFVDNRQVLHPVYDDRAVYHVGSDGYTERYAYATQYAYEVASHAPYAQQPRAQKPYYYPKERVAPPYSSLLSYGPTTYGGYVGTGYQSSTHRNYRTYMGSGVQSALPSYRSDMSTGGKQSHQPTCNEPRI